MKLWEFIEGLILNETTAPGVAKLRFAGRAIAGKLEENPTLAGRLKLKNFARTNNKKLRDQNFKEAHGFIKPLRDLAKFVLGIERGLGKQFGYWSAFRGWTLNGKTTGSSSRSQHPRGEATDFGNKKGDNKRSIERLYKRVLKYLIDKNIMFGQLIIESAKRDYGTAYWLHISLGHPYRAKRKCGQVLRKEPGKPYRKIMTVKFREEV